MTKEKLSLRHRAILNKDPTPAQLELYGTTPKKRGYASTKVLSAEQEATLFEAVFILALEQTFVEEGKPPPKVYLFVPAALERWAAQQLQVVARRMFDVCKEHVKRDADKGVARAKFLGESLRHVLIGSKVNVQTTPPDHWVAFGFDDSADVPSWLRQAVIPIYPFQRDD